MSKDSFIDFSTSTTFSAIRFSSAVFFSVEKNLFRRFRRNVSLCTSSGSGPLPKSTRDLWSDIRYSFSSKIILTSRTGPSRLSSPY